LRRLMDKPSFWIISLGAASSSMIGYGLFFWLPSFFVRSFGLELLDASVFYGAIILIGGIAGTWAGGYMADRFGSDKRGNYAIIPAVAFLATIPFYIIAILSPNLTTTFFALLVPTGLGLAWLGPVLSAIQHVVPPTMRATASAIFLFINNLIGLGAGTVALGIISDNLEARFGDDSLRYAILAGTGFYLIAAILFLASAKRLAKDWEE
jgi:MFS family permease